MKNLFRLKIKLVAIIVTVIFTISGLAGFSQSICISNSTGNTADPSSMLDIQSTSKGILIPRMSTSQLPSSPATGLLVYNTTTNKFNYYNGTAWIVLFSGNNGVNSISGTTDRISIGGTTIDPTIDISGNYTGQSSITNLGTISTGIWNGTTIDVAHGGTGQTSALTQGGVLYGSSVTSMSTTAAGTSGQILTSGGTGTPVWTPLLTAVTVNPTAFSTTAITTYSLLPSATITPGVAGDYLVKFTGYFQAATKDVAVFIELYKAGTGLSTTEVSENIGYYVNENVCLATTTVMTGIGASDAIEVYWKVDSFTGEMIQGALTVIRIK